jgi:hypothetical protein
MGGHWFGPLVLIFVKVSTAYLKQGAENTKPCLVYPLTPLLSPKR